MLFQMGFSLSFRRNSLTVIIFITNENLFSVKFQGSEAGSTTNLYHVPDEVRDRSPTLPGVLPPLPFWFHKPLTGSTWKKLEGTIMAPIFLQHPIVE